MKWDSLLSTPKIRFISIIAVFILFLFALPLPSYADWQSTLEGQFDVVSTFDDLNDWKGGSGFGNINIVTKPLDFPMKSDGSASIWQYYSWWGNGSISSNWIKNHGADNVWRGSGKSACIDYLYGTNDPTVCGPGRLGFKIGNSPADGYPNEVHVFFMTKWFKSFFKTNGNLFPYHSFLKTFDISSGFKSVERWGTDAERNWINSNCGGVPNIGVMRNYGMNAQIYNFNNGSAYNDKEGVMITPLVRRETDGVAQNCNHESLGVIHLGNANVGEPILVDKWFGIEYRVKTSNPHGAANGEYEIWVYDSSGNLYGHQLTTGIVNFRDGATAFNHGWNRFVWGGNRADGIYCPGGIAGCNFGTTSHFYLDDVIVNGSRIGPTYFAKLKSELFISFPGAGFKANVANFKVFGVSGISLPSAVIDVLVQGSSFGTTVANSAGEWSLNIDLSSLPEGGLSLKAVSGIKTSQVLSGTFDKSPPGVPIVNVPD